MALIFYTNRLVPARFDALTIGPAILMRPRCRGDIGLLEHELVHVRQWRRSFGLFWPLYLFSRKHRLRYELEAYRRHLEFAPDSAAHFAQLLGTQYRLNLPVEQAYLLLCA